MNLKLTPGERGICVGFIVAMAAWALAILCTVRHWL